MSPPTPDDWVVTNVAGVVREINDDLDTGAVAHATIRIVEVEDGTPADGTTNPTPSSPRSASEDNVFVAVDILQRLDQGFRLIEVKALSLIHISEPTRPY